MKVQGGICLILAPLLFAVPSCSGDGLADAWNQADGREAIDVGTSDADGAFEVWNLERVEIPASNGPCKPGCVDNAQGRGDEGCQPSLLAEFGGTFISDFKLSGDLLFSTWGSDGLRIYSAFESGGLQLLGAVRIPGVASYVEVIGGFAYVYTCCDALLYVVDVTDPHSPAVKAAFRLPGVTALGTAGESLLAAIYEEGLVLVLGVEDPLNSLQCRALETWPINSIFEADGVLYVGGNGHLDFYDTASGAYPSLIGTWLTGTEMVPVWADAGRAYVPVFEDKIVVLDTQHLDIPVVLNEFASGLTDGVFAMAGCAEALVVGGANGLFVHDRSDPENPNPSGRFSEGEWGEVSRVAINKGKAFAATSRGLIRVDIADPWSPFVDAFVAAGGSPCSGLWGQSSLDTLQVVGSGMAVVAYNDLIESWDISDPALPRLQMSVVRPGEEDGWVSWSINGLRMGTNISWNGFAFVIDPWNDPERLKTIDLSGPAMQAGTDILEADALGDWFSVGDGYLFVGWNELGRIDAYELSPAGMASLSVAWEVPPGEVTAFVQAGDGVVLTIKGTGLLLYEGLGAGNVTLAGASAIDELDYVYDLAVSGRRAFVTGRNEQNGTSELMVVDLQAFQSSAPAMETESWFDVAATDHRLYVLDWDWESSDSTIPGGTKNRVVVYDITSGALEFVEEVCPAACHDDILHHSIVAGGDYFYVWGDMRGILVLHDGACR